MKQNLTYRAPHLENLCSGYNILKTIMEKFRRWQVHNQQVSLAFSLPPPLLPGQFEKSEKLFF